MAVCQTSRGRKRPRRGPDIAGRIVQLGTGEGLVVAVESPHHQYLARRQRGGGVQLPCGRERTRWSPRVGDRVCRCANGHRHRDQHATKKSFQRPARKRIHDSPPSHRSDPLLPTYFDVQKDQRYCEVSTYAVLYRTGAAREGCGHRLHHALGPCAPIRTKAEEQR